MPKITRQSIEDVRQRADIVAFIGDYTHLKKEGAKYRGLSPFATEKTPSFYVNPDKGFFYCFSTAQGGDIFKFLIIKEGLNFQESVERVAARFGIRLEYEQADVAPEDATLRAQLYAIHEIAAARYAAAFRERDSGGEFIREYWTARRRFPLETAEEFQIGFAPVSGGDIAASLLATRRFSTEALKRCGLFVGTDYSNDPRRWRARFRGRLIIPIRDTQGRVVAFTARQLELTPTDDPTHDAKYINSPETDIFHKSQILFNLDKAREEVRKIERAKPAEPPAVLLVEGQLDAIRCHSCGLRTAVAGQGTSIGADHFRLIKRFASRVDALLDADRAGQAALFNKVLPGAIAEGLETRVLSVPGGKDPDEYFAAAAAGDGSAGGAGDATARIAEARAALLATSRSALAFAMDTLLPPDRRHSPEEKDAALTTLLDLVEAQSAPVKRAEMRREITRATGIEERVMDEVLRQRARAKRIEQRRAAARKSAPPPAVPAPTVPPEDYGADPVIVGNGNDAGTVPATAASPAAETSPAVLAGRRFRGAVKPKHNSQEEVLLKLVVNHTGVAEALAPVLNHVFLDKSEPAGQLLDRVLAEAQEGQWAGAEMLPELAETEEERNFVALIFAAPSEDGGAAAGTGAAAIKDTPEELTNRALEELIAQRGQPLYEDIIERVRIHERAGKGVPPALYAELRSVLDAMDAPPRVTLPPQPEPPPPPPATN
ncbi:MAG: DNA primase [Puniceicoccales bacterium]|nr:DNA primase [Puniceicoccales bacterium]